MTFDPSCPHTITFDYNPRSKKIEQETVALYACVNFVPRHSIFAYSEKTDKTPDRRDIKKQKSILARSSIDKPCLGLV